MICRTIEWRSADDAFAPLADDADAAFLTGGELAPTPGWGGSWSYLVAEPVCVIEVGRGELLVDGRKEAGDPFEVVSRLCRARRRGERVDGPALQSGLVGFVGYEAGGWIEPAGAGPASPYSLPDLRLAAYDAVAAFDAGARRAVVSGVDAVAVDRLAERLGAAGAASAKAPDFKVRGATVDRRDYAANVERVKGRILDGDFYQANLSRRVILESVDDASAFATFLRIMRKSSAGYAAFLPGREGAVLSASPELFFRIEPSSGGGARIVAEPIKGTRPRGATPEEDAALAAALLADPKDRAENVMIADLTRNDLSRICRDGGVREEAICALATHAGVHHLVSRIGGELLDGVDAAAALRALFPCGSITGAPKIEAMRAIAEIEGEGRGPYCGAIGFIDDAGASTFSVAIRTAVAERRSAALRLSLPVGGGVTLRSDSDAEYEETRTKARGLLAALGAAEPAA